VSLDKGHSARNKTYRATKVRNVFGPRSVLPAAPQHGASKFLGNGVMLGAPEPLN